MNVDQSKKPARDVCGNTLAERWVKPGYMPQSHSASRCGMIGIPCLDVRCAF